MVIFLPTVLSVFTTYNLVAGKNYVVSLSCDLSNPSKRHLYINGESASVTWATYSNDVIDLTRGNLFFGTNGSGTYFNGRLGNLYFNTTYIDLSIPANLAKFCTGTGIDCKPLPLGANGELPTGTAPLIYLPMYGNNAGKNYGTGGDFTVVSGPFVGARGPDEYWGNKADFDGSTGYLNRTSNLTGLTSGKVFSASFYIAPDVNSATQFILDGKTNADGWRFYISKNSVGQIQIQGRDSSGTTVLEANTTTTAITATAPGYVQMCLDLANSSNRFVYINGIAQSVTWSTFTNTNIDFSGIQKVRIGANSLTTPASYIDGKLSEFYLTTDYIDFSQEANRLKFRDDFGNPCELQSQIDAGTIPNPAVYMRFDPANQGKNYGTGGDFTKSGTITDGGQL